MVLFCSAKEFRNLCLALADKAERVRLQAKGGSMYPFLRSGDWVDVALRKGKPCHFKKGDLVLFKKDDNLYLHRVLRKTQNGVTAKGDMSFGDDGIIPEDDILGRVVEIQRGARRVNLCTAANRFTAVLVAESSRFLPYPLWIARKLWACAMAVLLRLQALKAYRRIIRKVLKGAVVVRVAGPQDQEPLRDLYRMAGRDVRDGFAEVSAEGFWLVAERKHKIVGGLTITPHGKDAALWVIFGLEVKPLLRGLGIGRAIVKEAIAKAREAGAEKIGLFVKKTALPALRLYGALGFQATDVLPPEFNRSRDELCLSYAIND